MPPLIMLPGMMLDGRAFAGQIGRLSAATQVVVGDITPADSIGQIARTVLIDAPGRFALAGLSMGAIVGFEIWRLAPERVTHLALIDTTPHADRPERSLLRLEQLAAVEDGRLKEVLVSSMKPLYLAEKNRGNAGLLRQILDMGLALGPEVFRRQSTALLTRPDSAQTLPTIDCPVLVLCGAEDSLCPVELHRTMAAEMPRAELVVLENCGHLAPMEEPAAVTDALFHLLRRAA